MGLHGDLQAEGYAQGGQARRVRDADYRTVGVKVGCARRLLRDEKGPRRLCLRDRIRPVRHRRRRHRLKIVPTAALGSVAATTAAHDVSAVAQGTCSGPAKRREARSTSASCGSAFDRLCQAEKPDWVCALVGQRAGCHHRQGELLMRYWINNGIGCPLALRTRMQRFATVECWTWHQTVQVGQAPCLGGPSGAACA